MTTREPVFEFTVRVRLGKLSHQTEPDDDRSTEPMTRGAVAEELKAHIADAVEAWGGQLWPGHVLHSSNFHIVTVSKVYKRNGAPPAERGAL
jgi:hypothetical protein